ncbi:AAA family ATPase, partial [bacterium]|nr:AAA family ATPase [bacterium]
IKDTVITMAATNRPDVLDTALLRPGRFDRQILVDRPDLKGRHEILKIHTRGKPLGAEIDLEVLARRTPGFTGADLANLVNEAALLSARHGKKEIDMLELEDAIERVIAGPEKKSRIISEKEKRVIAYHESGHALVGHVLPNTDPIHKISIISRGRALGYTLALPTEDKFLSARGEMLDQIAMMLGGRVAEAITMGDITTGASNDIERATKLARQMVTQYGMSEKLGPMTLGEGQHEVFLGRDFSNQPNYSQEIAFEIDKEIRRLIDEGYETAYKILTDRRELLDLMADVLVERETIDKDELEALLEGRWAEFMEEQKKREAEEEQKGKRKGRGLKAESKADEQPEPPKDERPLIDIPPPTPA